MEQSAPYRIFFGNNVRGLTVFFLNSSFAGYYRMLAAIFINSFIANRPASCFGLFLAILFCYSTFLWNSLAVNLFFT